MTTNRALLEAALVGYQHQVDEIKMKMAEIHGILGGKPATAAHAADVEAPTKKRTMSAAGRKRIAAAQRKRWAAQKTTGPAAPAKKRHMSAAGRKRIAEAARNRWAALRAEKAAAQ